MPPTFKKKYKAIDLHMPNTDWINLNLNAVNTPRQTTFITNKENWLKVGMNAFSNRAWFLNGKIKLEWLHLPYNSYKIKCKYFFLNWWQNLLTLSALSCGCRMPIIQITFCSTRNYSEKKLNLKTSKGLTHSK